MMNLGPKGSLDVNRQSSRRDIVKMATKNKNKQKHTDRIVGSARYGFQSIVVTMIQFSYKRLSMTNTIRPSNTAAADLQEKAAFASGAVPTNDVFEEIRVSSHDVGRYTRSV
jgi:hypothetical protein